MTPSERVASLEEGEVVDGPLLMKGLFPDKSLLAAVISKNEQGVATVELSFAGIRLATVAGKADPDPAKAGKVLWWEGKNL